MKGCPLVSHDEYVDGTDRQTDGGTPGGYITLSARRGQRDNSPMDIITKSSASPQKRKQPNCQERPSQQHKISVDAASGAHCLNITFNWALMYRNGQSITPST